MVVGFKVRQAVDYRFRGLGAIGSASDSRSEGWEFDSLRFQLFVCFLIRKTFLNSA